MSDQHLVEIFTVFSSARFKPAVCRRVIVSECLRRYRAGATDTTVAESIMDQARAFERANSPCAGLQQLASDACNAARRLWPTHAARGYR